MFVDLLDELFVDICEFSIEGLDFEVETCEGFLIREFLVKVGDGVEVDLFKF